MNILEKFKFHLKAIVKKRSLTFAIARFVSIIDRRIPLPNEAYLKHMSFYDEIKLEKHLNPSKNLVVVDIGANYGLWTLRYSKNYKEVHAFEPNPNTLALLKRNVRNCKNVKIYCCALGEEYGVADFFVHERPGRDGLVKKRLDYRGTISVPVKTLDSFGFNADLIKIDTEGYELPILMGGKITLERKKPQLFIEIHEKEQEVPIYNLLKELGYKYKIFEIRNEKQKFIITDYIFGGL